MKDELQRLKDSVKKLEAEKEYYKSIFENAPAPLLEEDLSEVKFFIDKLHQKGIEDIDSYFKANKDDLLKCIETFDDKFIANNEFLGLYKALSKEQFIDKTYTSVFKDSSYDTFRELFASFAKGKTLVSKECEDNALDGTPVRVIATWKVMPGCEKTWSRILLYVKPL